MHVGASIGLVAGSSPSDIWAFAESWEATLLVAYPLTLSDMANAPQAREGRFRLALSGGSPLAPRIKRDYDAKLGISLIESYGQSEFGGFMAMGSPAEPPRIFDGYVGTPLPDRVAYVGGADNEELPHGEIGEVLVPEGYFDGYKNKPEANNQTLRGGVLHCGDVAVSDSEGRLKVLGRVGEASIAKRRGAFLRTAEDALYEHPSVKHAVVVEGKGTGHVHGFVELLSKGTDAGELQAFVAERTAQRPQLSSIEVVDVMPRTFSGKADRLRLASGRG
jgi:acyl-coenzyme A synthetase/AMP-(fatty) acid ligase